MILSGHVKKLSPSACACVCAQSLSHVVLFVIPWTVACQGPLFHQSTQQLEFSRQPATEEFLSHEPAYLNLPNFQVLAPTEPILYMQNTYPRIWDTIDYQNYLLNS